MSLNKIQFNLNLKSINKIYKYNKYNYYTSNGYKNTRYFNGV